MSETEANLVYRTSSRRARATHTQKKMHKFKNKNKKRPRRWVFDKINKIDKPLPTLFRGHRGTTKFNKTRKAKGNITI